MLGYTLPLLVFTTFALAQETTSLGSGTTLLWIPFKTIPGTPLASIAQENPDANETVYVVSCPSAQPDCDIAPNITLTEGITTAGYSTTNSAGTAFLGCSIAGPTNAVCSDIASGNGQIERGTTSTLAPSQIIYQAVKVTATNTDTSSSSPTSISTDDNSSSQGTSSSTAGAVATRDPWGLGGAVGVGLFAVAVM